MDIDRYFKDRADLTERALAESVPEKLLAPDWRLHVGGLFCMASAIVAVLWASVTQSDPGFFVRTANFLWYVLGAGLWLLTIAQAAHVFLARTAIRSRDAVREKTLAQLLRTDGALAHKLLRRNL